MLSPKSDKPPPPVSSKPKPVLADKPSVRSDAAKTRAGADAVKTAQPGTERSQAESVKTAGAALKSVAPSVPAAATAASVEDTKEIKAVAPGSFKNVMRQRTAAAASSVKAGGGSATTVTTTSASRPVTMAGDSFRNKRINDYDNVMIVERPTALQPDSKLLSKSAPTETTPLNADAKVSPTETSTGVVMRPKSGMTHDVSKRKTIASGGISGGEQDGASGAGTTVFSEVKLKRASLHEPRDWENFEKTKPKPSEAATSPSSGSGSSDASPDNEFSQMFSKFKHRASKKQNKNAPEVKAVDIAVDNTSTSTAKTVSSTTKTENKVPKDSKPSTDSSAVGNKPSSPAEEKVSAAKTEIKSVKVVAKSVSVQEQAKASDERTTNDRTVPGVSKSNDVPSTTASAVKPASDVISPSASQPNHAFNLRPTGSGRAKSVFGGGGAKSTASTQPGAESIASTTAPTSGINQNRPKTVLIEKPVLKASNKSPTEESKVTNADAKSSKRPVADMFNKKPLIIEEKKADQSRTNTAKSDESTTSGDRHVTLLLSKPPAGSGGGFVRNQSAMNNKNNDAAKDENAKPSDATSRSAGSAFVPNTSVYKRPSPVHKDRIRSQTSPESIPSKDANSSSNGAASSTSRGGGGVTASPSAIQRSKSTPHKRIEITEKTPSSTAPAAATASQENNKNNKKSSDSSVQMRAGAQTGATPSWVSAARRKTAAFQKDEPTDVDDLESKTKVIESPVKQVSATVLCMLLLRLNDRSLLKVCLNGIHVFM